MNQSKGDNKRNNRPSHFVHVYIIPFVMTLVMGGLVYYFTEHFDLDFLDLTWGYRLTIILGILLFARNNFKWLPLPDKGYVWADDLKENRKTEGIHYSEPKKYDIIYSLNRWQILGNFMIVIFILGFSIYLMNEHRIIFPLLGIIMGISFLGKAIHYYRIKGIILKLSSDGLWIEELGFHPWSVINRTKITISNRGSDEAPILEIYLNNSPLNGVVPDGKINLGDIKNWNEIEGVIDRLKHGK